MSETLSHPGALGLKAGDFAKFLVFLNPEGIEPERLSWFTASLAHFYDLTWNKGVWIPGNCRRIFEVEGELETAFDPAVCEMRRFTRDHYWWEIEPVGSDYKLIVDTTGLPPERQIYKVFNAKDYSPYFGRPEFSQGTNLRMYTQSEPIDNLGTNMPLFYNLR